MRGIIESRHVLCGILCPPQIEGYCDHLPPLSERYWTVLILRTVELLPIWIMFIDRIIDRIWILVVILTTKLLNLAQIEPCCRVVVECGSLWQRNFPPSSNIRNAGSLILYDNTIHSSWCMLFNGIKVRPNHTTVVYINYLKYCTLIWSSPIFDIRPIGEGLIKRKVFAGAHTI